jgi:hypothetical protein
MLSTSFSHHVRHEIRIPSDYATVDSGNYCISQPLKVDNIKPRTVNCMPHAVRSNLANSLILRNSSYHNNAAAKFPDRLASTVVSLFVIRNFNAPSKRIDCLSASFNAIIVYAHSQDTDNASIAQLPGVVTVQTLLVAALRLDHTHTVDTLC